jgi:hypothetical protein
MAVARRDHTATLLTDGKVLIVGWYTNKAELYDPATGTFSPTAGETSYVHGSWCTATRLTDGKVLIVGGTNAPSSPEIYDPSTETFAPTNGIPNSPHVGHTATLLPGGKVLIAAGEDWPGALAHKVAELYDPESDTFTLTNGQLNDARVGHSATLLPNGKVLIAGGRGLSSTELFDPVSQSFAVGPPMSVERYGNRATLLPTGKVLIVGDDDASAELYDPVGNTFTSTGSMTVRRGDPTATLLFTDQVLVAGGYTAIGPGTTNSAELYDPATGTFTATASMGVARQEYTATLLGGGRVLVAGGYNSTGGNLSSAELFTPQFPVPNPVLVFLGTKASGSVTYYNLSVSNWQLYPPELFVLTDAYGPCGQNPTPSRTWVDIYAQGGRRIYGFCALPSPYGLTQIWFAETPPPAEVYVVLTDRQSNTKYKSNLLPIEGAAPNGYSPIAQPLNSGGGTNLYPFTVENVANVFNYKVTYPALSAPPANLVVQPILISQADLDALVVGTPFQGATIVPYDGTGGLGVLFRGTCQDSSGNPVVPCPQTTGPHDIKTSWETPQGATISNPAFLMAPVGTHAWQNVFTDLSVTRFDPTGSGRIPPGYSDFVFVQNISGTPPTITINTPPEGAIYLLNEPVPADFSCSPAPPTPPVVSCIGNVASGSNIDTSSAGSKTFTVNANVTAGPAGVKTVNYLVSSSLTPTVSFTGVPASAAYGATFSVAATTNASTTAVITASGACSITGNTVTMTSGTGTCSLTANWAADANYSAASLSQSTAATKIAPTVSFTGAPASAAYGATFNVAATTNASTTAVITASGICSITGNTVTMTSGTGTCSLTANWAADANYTAASLSQSTAATKAPLTVTATSTTKILDAPNPALNNVTYSGFKFTDGPGSLGGTLSCTTTATTTSPVGSYPITCSGLTSSNYDIQYVAGALKILYASGGICDGDVGHQILQPVNANGTSVWKQGRTIPAKFRVCDSNGVSIGAPGVVASFKLIEIISGTVTDVDETVAATNADAAFRWDSANQQWIFNISTSNLTAGSTYVYAITLNDGSAINFQYGLR